MSAGTSVFTLAHSFEPERKLSSLEHSGTPPVSFERACLITSVVAAAAVAIACLPLAGVTAGVATTGVMLGTMAPALVLASLRAKLVVGADGLERSSAFGHLFIPWSTFAAIESDATNAGAALLTTSDGSAHSFVVFRAKRHANEDDAAIRRERDAMVDAVRAASAAYRQATPCIEPACLAELDHLSADAWPLRLRALAHTAQNPYRAIAAESALDRDALRAVVASSGAAPEKRAAAAYLLAESADVNEELNAVREAEASTAHPELRAALAAIAARAPSRDGALLVLANKHARG